MKITVKETKCGEALSPKMQNRLKIKAWQDATTKMKGFQEAGHGFLDMFKGDTMNSIILPAECKDTEEEGEAYAKKLLGDLDDYFDIGTTFEEEGGPDGEDVYLPYYRLKKEFFDLSQEDGIKVLSELSDVLYKELSVGESKRKRNEEISPKLQDRLKFKELNEFLKDLPFFGFNYGEDVDTLKREGILYGVGDKETNEEAAKDILSDFEDYATWTIDSEVNRHGETEWFMNIKFKPELWALPIEELKKVFGLLDDAFKPWS